MVQAVFDVNRNVTVVCGGRNLRGRVFEADFELNELICVLVTSQRSKSMRLIRRLNVTVRISIPRQNIASKAEV